LDYFGFSGKKLNNGQREGERGREREREREREKDM